MAVNIKIEKPSSHNDVITSLETLLADNFMLAVQTQAFHWNVEGPNFSSYHKLFEEQYTALFNANDEIAERIRALGAKAPGSLKIFLASATLKEAPDNISATEMIQMLLSNYQVIINHARSLILLAASNHDIVTEDLVVTMLGYYEKTVWMLKSLLK